MNRYTIEVDQQNEHWRTDATSSPDFMLTAVEGLDGEVLDGEGETVAVGISISGPIAADVRDASSIEGKESRRCCLSIRIVSSDGLAFAGRAMRSPWQSPRRL